MRLSDLLKTKSIDLASAQMKVINEVRDFNYIVESFTPYDENEILGYGNDQVKKRAMTIGTAFNIAFKIVLAKFDNRQHFNEVLQNSVFGECSNNLATTLESMVLGEFDMSKLVESTVYSLQDLTTDDQDFITKVASYSVTLAWVKAYCESNYWPKDISVMQVSSETHQLLLDEVAILLADSFEKLIKPSILDGEHELIINPKLRSEDADIEYTADFIFDGTLYDIHTTANIKNQSTNTNKIAAAFVLNKISNNYPTVSSFGVYYPRFNLVENYIEDEQLF